MLHNAETLQHVKEEVYLSVFALLNSTVNQSADWDCQFQLLIKIPINFIERQGGVDMGPGDRSPVGASITIFIFWHISTVRDNLISEIGLKNRLPCKYPLKISGITLIDA